MGGKYAKNQYYVFNVKNNNVLSIIQGLHMQVFFALHVSHLALSLNTISKLLANKQPVREFEQSPDGRLVKASLPVTCFPR